MKKFLLSIIAIVTLTCVFSFAGCEEPHEHEFGEWKTAKEATCTAEGTMERTCECGEKETKPIDKIKHTNGSWIIDKEATCTEEGFKHLECTVCKETTVSGSIPATGHTDGEWIVDVEATCTTDGSKHQVCSVCEASIKTEAIAALGHNLVFDSFDNDGVIGSNAIFKCSTCNDEQPIEIKPIEAWANLDVSYTEMFSHRSHREYTVIATGGYGELQYKFEVIYVSYNGASERPELLSDFSPINTCSYDVYAFFYTAYLQVTIMDEAGNTNTFNVADPGYSMW